MDVLRLPVVGPLLRWRHVRLLLQTVLLVVAGIVVGHGLFGTQVAPRNLATVLTSIHWRGFLVLALVVVGNLFCTACPMILVRDAGRRLVPPRFSWPRRLRRKWVGLGLLVLVLFFVRAVRPVGAAERDRVARARLLRPRAARRSPVQRRVVLQVRLPDRTVQLHRVHDGANRVAGARYGDLSRMPHLRLHQGTPDGGRADSRRAAGL